MGSQNNFNLSLNITVCDEKRKKKNAIMIFFAYFMIFQYLKDFTMFKA